MASAMNGVLVFLDNIGLFDVLLPFIMIYVMIFALLERTLILGYENIKSEDGSTISVPKKNINSIFAFAVSFFAILSSKVVETIHRSIGPMVILLLILILFILLVSVFRTEMGIHDFTSNKQAMIFFIILIFISTFLIFMNAITTDNGNTWLEVSWKYVTDNTNTGFVGAIFLLVFIGGFIWWIGRDPSSKPSGGDS